MTITDERLKEIERAGVDWAATAIAELIAEVRRLRALSDEGWKREASHRAVIYELQRRLDLSGCAECRQEDEP